MRETIHLEIVSFEALEYGDLGRINKESEDLNCLVLSKYHLRDLTGHTNLSSLTDEPEAISGRKIGFGVNDIDWFLERKAGSGSR